MTFTLEDVLASMDEPPIPSAKKPTQPKPAGPEPAPSPRTAPGPGRVELSERMGAQKLVQTVARFQADGQDEDEILHPAQVRNIFANFAARHDDRLKATADAAFALYLGGHDDAIDDLCDRAEARGLTPEAIQACLQQAQERAAERQLPDNVPGKRTVYQDSKHRLAEACEKPVEPLETFDVAHWNGKEPEQRRWVTSLQIPCGEPGLLNGDGGTGKTTAALQLANAVADEDVPDWLGKCVESHGPVIFYSIEEKMRELHWRFTNIRASRNLGNMRPGRWHIIADLKDAVLARPEKGILKPTLALHRLEKTVEKIRPALVIIENAADVFLGSEIDRAPVSMFVRVMLGGLCVPSDAAMMLLQHPSVSGLQDGTGRSGSTAWNNAGRWRLNFTFAKEDDESDDLRQLKTEKLNYGKRGETFKVRWVNGVFVLAGAVPTLERAAAEAEADDVFMRCFRTKAAQGIVVSPHPGRNYAPNIFEGMPEAKGYKAKALAKAMERALSAGRIAGQKIGSAARHKTVLVEC